ncbi:hypothetical protein P692DRAFT_20745613 [Suillus brevipes Sb2]|nr:hypothetical protein P692DRAFT_20745613 [Suillus brevipes Sb2]
MLTIIHVIGSVNIFWLVVNPNHFGQSMENLFILSGLFGNGLCGFRISDNGEPIIYVHLPSTQQDQQHNLTVRQMVWEFNMATWSNAIDVFEIRETMMAHRPPCVH